MTSLNIKQIFRRDLWGKIRSSDRILPIEYMFFKNYEIRTNDRI